MKNLFLLTSSLTLFLLTDVSAKLLYAGTNEAGAEFGSNIPGVYGTDYTFPRPASIDYFVLNGMNVFRLPFLWERLQTTLEGSFDSAYLSYIDSTVNYVTNTKGSYIILDVHNYARYNNLYLGESAEGAPTYQNFQDLWQSLATLYKSNPRVIFGLMNEPNTMPYENVYLGMQAGMNGVRASGATNLVLVPGNDWTGVHSWLDGSSAVMGAITDPLNNFMFEMHQYFDDNFSGNGNCVPTFDPTTIFGPATQWLRSLGRTAFLGEFGIENTAECLAVLKATLAYLEANSDVWQGYTWWAAGPWWGPTYPFNLEQGVGNAQLAVLTTHLPSTSSTPSSTPSSPVASSTTGKPASTPASTPVPIASSTGKLTTTHATSTSTSGKKAATTASTPVPIASSTTGKSTPHPSTSTTGSTPVHVASSTTTGQVVAAPPTTPVVISTPNSACALGNQVCVGSTQYQTCTNGRTGNFWATPQSCQAGLVCSPSGNNIYCVR